MVDPNTDAEARLALIGLRQAIQNILDPPNAKTWPEGAPRPVETPTPRSWEHYAEELSLVSTAFMVHHELAHIRRRHVKSSGTWSVEQEREADYEAADWILGPNPNLRDALFTKQMPGVSLALEALVVRNIYGGREEGITHPYSWDRIFNTLSRYIPDGGHPVYAFIIFTMKLHLDNAAVTTPQRVFTDFYECFNTYVEVLSRRDARSPGHA